MRFLTTMCILLCVSTLARSGGMFDSMGSSMMGAMSKIMGGAGGGDPMAMAQQMMGMLQEGGDDNMAKLKDQFQGVMDAMSKLPQSATEEAQKAMGQAQQTFEELMKKGAPPDDMQKAFKSVMDQMQAIQG